MSRRIEPYRCPDCGADSVMRVGIPYECKFRHGNCMYTTNISNLHALKCWVCGCELFDNISDSEISEAIRLELGLISPFEIQKRLHSRGLTVENLQQYVGPEVDLQRILDGCHLQTTEVNKKIWEFLA